QITCAEMKRSSILALAGLAIVALATALPAQDNLERRRADLQLLRDRLLPVLPLRPGGRINAYDTTWEDWLRRTGELPPDFDAMPSVAHLPDPLVSLEGSKPVRITSAEQWAQQRQWIRSQVEH